MSRCNGSLDIAARLASKYDVGREIQAREWIETVVGETFPHQEFQLSLKDGVILCKLMNVLIPGFVKIKSSKMPFVQEVEFSDEVLNAGKAVINTYQYGYSGGANQSGVRTGRREIGGVDPGRTQSPSGRF
ncbi:hypothetical protein BGZ67_006650 [Mortierella alpina]|nr:hypothetical protein BGZ67_006650 [Mortierella alpina]